MKTFAAHSARLGALMTTVAAAAVWLQAGVAGAQTVAAGSSPTSAAQTPPAAQITDVIVTEQKRSESIQKTPIAITAVSGQQLKTELVEELADLGTIVPNIQLVTISQTVQVNARGVGSNFFDPRAQASLAQSIDGLYYTRPPQSGSHATTPHMASGAGLAV